MKDDGRWWKMKPVCSSKRLSLCRLTIPCLILHMAKKIPWSAWSARMVPALWILGIRLQAGHHCHWATWQGLVVIHVQYRSIILMLFSFVFSFSFHTTLASTCFNTFTSCIYIILYFISIFKHLTVSHFVLLELRLVQGRPGDKAASPPQELKTSDPT
jgi:hypothetical protein